MVCRVRSPNAGNGYNARNVNSDGTLNNNNAYNGNRGVRPDLIELRLSSRKVKAEAYHYQSEDTSRPDLTGEGRTHTVDALGLAQWRSGADSDGEVP